MGLNSIVRSSGYKNFMGKVYGWGAALVIIGALFKIQHYPGSGFMLGIGLGTEALIFFLSAFEPPHVEPDWSLVYPELSGMYQHDDVELDDKGKEKKSITEELDSMLQEAKIDPVLLTSLGDGLRKLSDSTTKLSDVSNASVATNEYVTNMKSASKSANDLSDSYKRTTEVLQKDISASGELSNNIKNASKSANDLSNSYSSVAETIKKDLNANEEYVKSMVSAKEAVNNLTQKYNQSSELLTKSVKAMDFSSIDSNEYVQKLQLISKNLSALNNVYELQLKSSTEQQETTLKLQREMNKFIENLNVSTENTSKYKEQAAMLTQNVAALNNVYGNMLAAMNVNVNINKK